MKKYLMRMFLGIVIAIVSLFIANYILWQKSQWYSLPVFMTSTMFIIAGFVLAVVCFVNILDEMEF